MTSKMFIKYINSLNKVMFIFLFPLNVLCEETLHTE